MTSCASGRQGVTHCPSDMQMQRLSLDRILAMKDKSIFAQNAVLAVLYEERIHGIERL